MIQIIMDTLDFLPPAISDVEWKHVLASTCFIFIDGPSSSGKSTLKNALVSSLGERMTYSPRYCTRTKRQDDDVNNDYYFVSKAYFEGLIMTNDLVEYRHFMFDMSYGIGKSALGYASRKHRNVLSLMNIGNASKIKNVIPNSFCIYINVPVDTLKTRLEKRGLNSDEQIKERLNNAAIANQNIHDYDFVLNNLDGKFVDAFSSLHSKIEKLLY
jgi:guanylate kinase